jgi:hypothetical protein
VRTSSARSPCIETKRAALRTNELYLGLPA